MTHLLGKKIRIVRGKGKGRTADVYAVITTGRERRQELIVFFGDGTTPTLVAPSQVEVAR